MAIILNLQSLCTAIYIYQNQLSVIYLYKDIYLILHFENLSEVFVCVSEIPHDLHHAGFVADRTCFEAVSAGISRLERNFPQGVEVDGVGQNKQGVRVEASFNKKDTS